MIIEKKGYIPGQMFTADETRLFMKEIGNHLYIKQTAKAPGLRKYKS